MHLSLHHYKLVLACKMSKGMAVEGKRPALILIRLRSNARKQVEKKCGWKRPRLGGVIPEPSSEEAKSDEATILSHIELKYKELPMEEMENSVNCHLLMNINGGQL